MRTDPRAPGAHPRPKPAPRAGGYWALYAPDTATRRPDGARYTEAECEACIQRLRANVGYLTDAPHGDRLAPQRPPRPGYVHVAHTLRGERLFGSVVLLDEAHAEALSEREAILLQLLHNGGCADVRTLCPGGRVEYMRGTRFKPFGGIAPEEAGYPPCHVAAYLERARGQIADCFLLGDYPALRARAEEVQGFLERQTGHRPGDTRFARWWYAAYRPVTLFADSLRARPGDLAAARALWDGVVDILFGMTGWIDALCRAHRDRG